MRKLIILFCWLIICIQGVAQLTLCSWNLKDFGKSKSDETIAFIASLVNDYDIVAVQEVVAGYGGAQAVARLHEALNRKGYNWDYRVSEVTSGNNSYKHERYAFLWKTSRVKLVGKPALETQYEAEIDREPYLATFSHNNKEFTVVNFHAITKSMQPETEIKYLKLLPAAYPGKNLIFCGDFNCPQSHTVFNPLKAMGYKPALINQKTSLKENCVQNNCLASEFDNVFFNTGRTQYLSAGPVLFFNRFNNDLQRARTVSDHVPVIFRFNLN